MVSKGCKLKNLRWLSTMILKLKGLYSWNILLNIKLTVNNYQLAYSVTIF